MEYEYSESLQVLAEDISRKLFPHIKTSRIKCFRSDEIIDGKIIARCHSLGKIMQKSLNCDGFYALEFFRKKFDDLSTENKVKTVIRELVFISKKFGEGFSNYDIATEKNIDFAYKKYLECRKNNIKIDLLKEINNL